jgi:ornithine cyclodeaminase/alanine dehydrogenase-like protein (mu-crystallin family)
VAAKWLARPDSKIAGVIGTGTQARLQLKALTLVRDIERAVVWGRDSGKARACADDSAADLGIDVTPVSTVADAMGQSDIVVTTTPSAEPLIDAVDLRPGQHVTAMGSDTDYKAELAPGVLAAADVYACDSYAQCLIQGELRAAVAAGAVTADLEHIELGSMIASGRPGRTSDREITVCDLTGTGVQDTAIAALAHERAVAGGAGSLFNSE